MTPRRAATILLSEGSSLSARQTITALGPLGYTIDVCDTNPKMCLARFSRFVRRVYRCPALGRDPLGYLAFVEARLDAEPYDVLLPVHEQAFLFSRVQERLAGKAGLALGAFEAMAELQSKATFTRLLDRLDLPHPATRYVHDRGELDAIDAFPCYVKAPYSTAGRGVWRVDDLQALAGVAGELVSLGLLDGRSEVLVQSVATGDLSQAQALFEHGCLIAVHCTSQQAEGAGGSQSARLSVDHPSVREHLAGIGQHLDWHGPVAIDYFWDRASGAPSYIEANPRMVEPMNGVLSGANVPDMLVRLSLGETFAGQPLRIGRFGVRSHAVMSTLLGDAMGGGSRRALLATVGRALLRRGPFRDSHEDLTPLRIDPRSGIILGMGLAMLLANPANARKLVGGAVADYALSPAAVEQIVGMDTIALP